MTKMKRLGLVVALLKTSLFFTSAIMAEEYNVEKPKRTYLGYKQNLTYATLNLGYIINDAFSVEIGGNPFTHNYKYNYRSNNFDYKLKSHGLYNLSLNYQVTQNPKYNLICTGTIIYLGSEEINNLDSGNKKITHQILMRPGIAVQFTLDTDVNVNVGIQSNFRRKIPILPTLGINYKF